MPESNVIQAWPKYMKKDSNPTTKETNGRRLPSSPFISILVMCIDCDLQCTNENKPLKQQNSVEWGR